MNDKNHMKAAPVHQLVGPFQNDGLNSPDYTCRDYELLERRYKMTGWDSSQQGIYEAGWEAATRYYWDLFKRPSRGNVRKVDDKGRIALLGFVDVSSGYTADVDACGVITLRPNSANQPPSAAPTMAEPT